MEQIQNKETTLEDRGLEKRQSFLLYPGESPEVDYKDGVVLKSGEPFSLKLVKHILGMCNAGGGFIVIGYRENESNKHPEPIEIDESVVASYDVSSLASLVERYTQGSDKIDLVVHKDAHPTSGVIYPIIEVKGFRRRPFFCKSTAGGLLDNGALYLRIASARTVKVESPDEWEQLIDHCVERRQDDLLSRFTALLREAGLPKGQVAASPSVNENQEWTNENRKELIGIGEKHSIIIEGLEFEHHLIENEPKVNQKQLLEIAQSAKRPNTGWAIGLVGFTPEHKPIIDKDHITSRIVDPNRIDYWRIKTNGQYFFFRKFEEDQPRFNKEGERVLWFDVRIWRVAELIEHTIAFHKALGTNPTAKINLTVRHLGLQERLLTASDPMRAFSMSSRQTKATNSEWSKVVSIDLLQAERNVLIGEICRELFMLFDFWEPGESVVNDIIAKYDSAAR